MPSLEDLLLLLLIDLGAGDRFVEVHEMAVEFGAVHAGELHLAVHGQAAAAAHAGKTSDL